MAPQQRTITIEDGLTLAFVEQGNASEPALVMLPGPTDSWRSYQEVLASLPPSIRTVVVSPRGHGDSDKPPTGYGIKDFAADVVPVLDALGIERAVLVGHSGSCLVARRVAIDSPDRVAGLVLEASPTTLRGHVRLNEFVSSVIAQLADPIDSAFARSVVVDTASERVSPRVLEDAVADLQKVPARVWREMFAALLEYDDTAEIGRVTAPTLLVWGDADEIVGRQMQETLVAQLSAELVVYPGVGHTPRYEDPTRFAADISAHLAKMP